MCTYYLSCMECMGSNHISKDSNYWRTLLVISISCALHSDILNITYCRSRFAAMTS